MKKDSIITLKSKIFNQILVNRCRQLGGKFDKKLKTWIFSSLVEKEVKDLDFVFNSQLIAVEIIAKDYVCASGAPLAIAGQTLARVNGRRDRDSGPMLAKNVCLIAGNVYENYITIVRSTNFNSSNLLGGWGINVEKGTILRLFMPVELVKQQKEKIENDWRLTVIEKKNI